MFNLRTAVVVAASLMMAGSSVASSKYGAGQLAVSVDMDGTIIKNNGVASVKRANNGTTSGEWVVTFNRNIEDCVWTGSIGYGRFRGTFPPTFISVSGQYESTKALLVQTYNGSSRKLQDAPFALIVICS